MALHPAGCRRGPSPGYRAAARPDVWFGEPVGEDRANAGHIRGMRPTAPAPEENCVIAATESEAVQQPTPRPGRVTAAGPTPAPGSPPRTPSGVARGGRGTGLRCRRVERLSYPLLVRLHAAAALAGHGRTCRAARRRPARARRRTGRSCLAVVVLLMSWLTYLAWHQGDRSRRVVRLVALGLAVAALVLRLLDSTSPSGTRPVRLTGAYVVIDNDSHVLVLRA